MSQDSGLKAPEELIQNKRVFEKVAPLISPKYAIGIDLGTSHCALAYKKLDSKEDVPPEVFKFSQWETESTLVTSDLLPSWYYITTKNEVKRGLFKLSSDSFIENNGSSKKEDDEANVKGPSFVLGRLARYRAASSPGRVVHSAKSWLVASHVDRRSALLPWGSDEILGSDRLSPVQVSSAYLKAMREQWNLRFPEAPFDAQYLTVTVPASFDEVAQRLTLEALDLTRSEGHHDHEPRAFCVKLLEEPQASFYATLSTIKKLFGSADQHQPEKIILVCDIGGGTSDFSLFKMDWEWGKSEPKLTRIAVSEHILLGGDNIDLALAQEIERIHFPGESLSPSQLKMLVHGVRQLKENLLSESVDPKDTSEEGGSDQEVPHQISILSNSSTNKNLFQSVRTVSITKKRVVQMINEGFFPLVDRDSVPFRQKGGLRQLGLPYAQDSAVTRYLAEFLSPLFSGGIENISDSGVGKTVDAVLFVGGTLKPRHLQDRLLKQLCQWQGKMPVQIPVESMDLAIAQGASFYGFLRYWQEKHLEYHGFAHEHQGKVSSSALIGGGYPRSVYVEVQHPGQAYSQLVCLVPKGFDAHHRPPLVIQNLPLFAAINQQVRFQIWTSRLRGRDAMGDLILMTPSVRHEFEPLPPLTAVLATDHSGSSPKKQFQKVEIIPVYLTVELADTGVLLVRCVPESDQASSHQAFPIKGWPLDFNLRATDSEKIVDILPNAECSEQQNSLAHASAKSDPAGPAYLEPSIPESVGSAIEQVFGKKSGDSEASPKGLIKELERLMGVVRENWDLHQLRQIYDLMADYATKRTRSAHHEATWINLAGYTLRPGYGHSRDIERMNHLLRHLEAGIAFSKDRNVQEQFWILQRRVSGGMGNSEQNKVLGKLMPIIRKNEAPSQEVYRLVGSLERADMQEKVKLGSILVQQIVSRRPPFLDQKIWTLGRIVGRVLLYGEAQHIIIPKIVGDWFHELWKIPPSQEIYPKLAWVWLQGARRIEARELNLTEEVRQRVLKDLRALKISSNMIRCVEEYVPPDEKFQTQLFGEKLPLGLMLAPH